MSQRSSKAIRTPSRPEFDDAGPDTTEVLAFLDVFQTLVAEQYVHPDAKQLPAARRLEAIAQVRAQINC